MNSNDQSARSCGCDPGADYIAEGCAGAQGCLSLSGVINQGRPVSVSELPHVQATSPAFTVKDSGARQQFDSGMVRDITTGKTDYTLAFDGPMFERWAAHLTKGAEKYAKRNWMQASGSEEQQRFRESAVRHFLQWMRGEQDEDHAAAVFFNISGYEYVTERLKEDA